MCTYIYIYVYLHIRTVKKNYPTVFCLQKKVFAKEIGGPFMVQLWFGSIELLQIYIQWNRTKVNSCEGESIG